MNTKRNNKGQSGQARIPNRNNKNKDKSQNGPSRQVGLYVPLHPDDIMPPRIERRLNYIDSTYNRSNSGANYLVYALRVNDLFDPDPLILTGSVSGFKEIMQFYSTYRTIQNKVHLKISNNENFPLLYGYVFTQTSLVGVVGNRDDAINALENDFSTRGRLLAAKGGIDTDEIESTLNMSLLLGSRQQYMAEVGYTGQGINSPAIPLFLNLIIASPSATNLSNGVTTALTLQYHSEFFGRLNIRA